MLTARIALVEAARQFRDVVADGQDATSISHAVGVVIDSLNYLESLPLPTNSLEAKLARLLENLADPEIAPFIAEQVREHLERVTLGEIVDATAIARLVSDLQQGAHAMKIGILETRERRQELCAAAAEALTRMLVERDRLLLDSNSGESSPGANAD